MLENPRTACNVGREISAPENNSVPVRHLRWIDLDDEDDILKEQAARILGVKPATVRVLAHRGQLTVTGYITESSEGEQGHAVYSRTEVVALAKRRGVRFAEGGYTATGAAYELRITQAQVAVLIAAGELQTKGRSEHGNDLYDVRRFAQERGLALYSESPAALEDLRAQRRWREELERRRREDDCDWDDY